MGKIRLPRLMVGHELFAIGLGGEGDEMEAACKILLAGSLWDSPALVATTVDVAQTLRAIQRMDTPNKSFYSRGLISGRLTIRNPEPHHMLKVCELIEKHGVSARVAMRVAAAKEEGKCGLLAWTKEEVAAGEEAGLEVFSVFPRGGIRR